MNYQHQNAQRNVSMSIQLHLPRTNIMVQLFMQLIQIKSKSKLNSSKMDQLKLLSQSMLIFLHTKQVSINTHLVKCLVDMVCIFFLSLFSQYLIIDFLSYIAVKILGWGVDESSSAPYWLVANCKFISSVHRYVKY